MFVIEVGVTYY